MSNMSDHLGSQIDVAKLYTSFPHASRGLVGPGAPPPAVDRADWRAPGLEIRAIQRLFGVEREASEILDAGCGTGHIAERVAAEWAGHRVTGIDLTQRHVDICQANHPGLPNLTYAQCDLTKLAESRAVAIPRGGFDVVLSIGVLHHITDPLAGLRSLTGALSADGLMILYFYDAYVMYLTHLIRRGVFLMGHDMDEAQRIRLARILLSAVRDEPRFAKLFADNLPAEPDWYLADLVTHPVEYTYTIEETAQLLGQVDLEIVGMYDGSRRNTEDPLLHPDLFLQRIAAGLEDEDQGFFARAFTAMPAVRRLHLLQLLFERPVCGLTLIAGRRGRHPSRLFGGRDAIAEAAVPDDAAIGQRPEAR